MKHFWVSRGAKRDNGHGFVMFTSKPPEDDNKWVSRCMGYHEFSHFSGITLKPGWAVKITVGKSWRWQRKRKTH